MSGLDETLVSKAVKALYGFELKKSSEKNKKVLIESYAKPLIAQVQLVKKIENSVLKPVRVKIPHTLFNVTSEEHTICIFCKSSDKGRIEKYLSNNPIEGIQKIISLDDVKKHYQRFNDKKKLLSEYTHFITDSSIMGHLYNLLGKVFATNNNYPIPVDLPTNYNKLEATVKKVVDSTYMHLKGSNIGIRFGHMSMSPADVVNNIIQGFDFATNKLKGGWKNIRSIHLKTSDSAALPIYSKLPDETLNYVKKIVGEDEDKSDNSKSSGTKKKNIKDIKTKSNSKDRISTSKIKNSSKNSSDTKSNAKSSSKKAEKASASTRSKAKKTK